MATSSNNCQQTSKKKNKGKFVTEAAKEQQMRMLRGHFKSTNHQAVLMGVSPKEWQQMYAKNTTFISDITNSGSCNNYVNNYVSNNENNDNTINTMQIQPLYYEP